MHRDPMDDAMLIIRDMTEEDYDDVVEVWRCSGLKFSAEGRDSRDRVVGQLRDPTSIFFVAEVARKVVGTALCTQDGRKGWINRLAVLPEYRRRGIGGMMVREAENRFAALGLEVYCCLIMADNPVSQGMFSSKGYRHHEDVLYFSKRTRDDA